MKVNEWVSNISNFIFLCPTCHEISLRLNTMVKHMKSCMKKREAKEYLNQKVNCPECPGFKDTIDRLIYHFRTKHLLVSICFLLFEKSVPNADLILLILARCNFLKLHAAPYMTPNAHQTPLK